MPYRVRCILPSNLSYYQVGCGTLELLDGSEEEAFVEESGARYIALHEEDGTISLISQSALGDKFGFEYTQRLVFMSERDLRNYPYWGLDNHEGDFLTAQDLDISERLEQGDMLLHQHLSVRFVSHVVGFGLFTNDTELVSGSYVGEYVGVVLGGTCSGHKPSAYSLSYPCSDGGHEINAKEIGNVIRFINHSSLHSNIEFVHVFLQGIVHVLARVKENVPPHTQLFVDYGASYWSGQGVSPS